MKKILAVLVAITVLFSMTAPSAFAAKKIIPFWQHGGGMYTFISIVGNGIPQGNGTDYTSTSKTITVTLTATDDNGGYTVLPTSGTPATTAGATFAVATFTAEGAGQQMLIDTWQIGTSLSTNVWSTAGGRYATSSSGFGYGLVNTGTSAADNFAGWACVYNGAVGSQSGFTMDLGEF